MGTMYSLSQAATNFDMEIADVSPPERSLTDEFKQQLIDRAMSSRNLSRLRNASEKRM
ncbi:MAG: hypothetical protein ACXAC2_01080 [Candidatus Kariarchaeaceae archaeon]